MGQLVRNVGVRWCDCYGSGIEMLGFVNATGICSL